MQGGQSMKLTQQQIMTVVNRYITVMGGYLGDFSYRTHADFYPEYCGIDDVFPETYDGTTRERFIQILTTRKPHDQAKILRGVVDRFGDNDAGSEPRMRLRGEILQWAAGLEGTAMITIASPAETREVVLRALGDANNLIQTSGPASVVDRIHTALHGHLLAVCESAGIEVENDASATRALKLLRQQHPALQATGPRAEDITRVLNSLANVLDTLNPIRNNASVAHPNRELLDAPEALLAINAGRTIFAYLDEKLGHRQP
jgi:hypothetical protein